MRFGLSDLGELPSLKEFEQLARAALGSDEGIALIEPEDMEAMNASDAAAPETSDFSETTAVSESADTVESPVAGESAAEGETFSVSEIMEVDVVSETPTQELPMQELQEMPEAAQPVAEHSEKARAESAS